MKKKGFTMIELLISIVVLALILSFTIPSVIVLINRQKQSSEDLLVTNIEKAALLYAEEYPENIKWTDTGGGIKQVCLTIKEIRDKGYLKSSIKNNLDKYDETRKVLLTLDASSVKTVELIEESGECVFDTSYPSVSIDNISTTTKSITYDLSCSNENSNLYYVEYKDLKTNEMVRVYVENSKTFMQTLTFDNLKSDHMLTLEAKCVNKGRKEASTSVNKNLDDITAPVITVNKQGWSNEKIVTITYSDPNHNLGHYYRMDPDSKWVDVKTDSVLTKTSNSLVYTYTYNTPGEHIIQAQTSDGTNNKSNNLTVSLIDVTPPTCSITKGSGSTSGVTLTVTGEDDASGFGTSTNNDLTKDYTYNNVKSSGTYTVTDAAGNSGTCDVDVYTKTVTRSCNTCSRCSSASCESYSTREYNCSSCHTGDPSVCQGGYVYDSCYSTKCTCSKGSPNSTCTRCYSASISISSCVNGGGSCSSTEGSGCTICNYGSPSKQCVGKNVWDSCKTTISTCEYGCDSETYCDTRARSCSSCGCDSWGSWSETTSCSSSSSTECSTSYY